MCRKYRPSNGTEGMWFTEKYCDHCIHEKFTHTQQRGDLQCDILNRAFLFDEKDPEYPEEWTYDASNNPICTNHVPWNWRNDDDDGGWNDPPEPIVIGPNQLVLFALDDLGLSQDYPTKEQVIHLSPITIH